jgi:hypothetical protein
MMSLHKHSDIFYAWPCEGVSYHTPGGISSPMNTDDSPISLHKIFLFNFRTVIDTICDRLTSYWPSILHVGWAERDTVYRINSNKY